MIERLIFFLDVARQPDNLDYFNLLNLLKIMLKIFLTHIRNEKVNKFL
jgi:hypothetical protein